MTVYAARSHRSVHLKRMDFFFFFMIVKAHSSRGVYTPGICCVTLGKIRNPRFRFLWSKMEMITATSQGDQEG